MSPANAALANSRIFIALLIIMSMMSPMALNIIMPSMPGLIGTFNTSRERVQLVLSLYFAGMAVSQVILGPLADRLGRRPVLFGGAALYMLASIAAVFAPTIEWLIAARLAQAAGATSGAVLARAIVRDIFEREQAASMIGYVTMGMAVAPMFSPLIGGILDETFGWQAIFLVCAAVGFAVILLAIPILSETRPAATASAGGRVVLQRTLSLLVNRRFLGYAGTSAFASCVFFAFLGGAPYIVIDIMQLPKSTYGIWFGLIAIGYMSGNAFSGRFSTRIGVERMINLGNIFTMTGCVLVTVFALGWFPAHPASLFLPCMFFSVGNGLTNPNAIAGGVSVDPSAAGSASGLMGFLQMTSGAVASYLAGQLTTTSALPMALVMLVCGALSLIAAWFTRSAPATHPR